jgi:tetratricopeptide (TPR) repeat protein
MRLQCWTGPRLAERRKARRNRTKTRTALLGSVALVTLMASPTVGFAQETATATTSEDAKALADHGRALYQQGKYEQALAVFQRAYAKDPTASMTYNIARCHERLSQWGEALTAYQRYATEAEDPRDRTDAQDKAALIQARIATDSGSRVANYEARMNSGRDAYRRGDYNGAVDAFKAAFDTEPTGSALYNVAKSYEKMSRYEEAADYFSQYLEVAPTAPDRKDVQESIRRLRRSIASRFQELAISSQPIGADVYLDDRNRGHTGQTDSRLKVSPGPHTLYIDLNGYETVKREFVMPDDQPLALDFAMKKLEVVGYLEIDVNRDGARIFVDGAIVGVSPFKQHRAVEVGTHQVQVELAGFSRFSQEVEVDRDQITSVKAELTGYSASDRYVDDTLSHWGGNLVLIGVIGGAAGFIGPWVYQQVAMGRDPFEQLGPETPSPTSLYKGPLPDGDPARRSNSKLETLQDIQKWSLIGGGIVAATGLGLYIYEWVSDDGPPSAVAQIPAFDQNNQQPLLSITALGISPNPDGGTTMGLSGSF